MKALILAYLSNGEQWPEEVNAELRKYYRRTYINPNGPKHSDFSQWRDEWAKENGLTFLQRMYIM